MTKTERVSMLPILTRLPKLLKRVPNSSTGVLKFLRQGHKLLRQVSKILRRVHNLLRGMANLEPDSKVVETGVYAIEKGG